MFSLQTKIGLKKGCPQAYQEVFQVLYPRMKGYCKLFVTDENEAEDIIQDCFVSLWEKRNSIDSGKKIESLVFVMLRNRCLNYLKEKRLKMENVPVEQLRFSELQHLYQLDMNDEEEEKLETLFMASFQEAVNSLPDRMKQVFVQCKLQGKKQKDVARDLGISLKTVEKHIAKAKNIIEDQLRMQHPSLIAMVMVNVLITASPLWNTFITGITI